MLDENAVFNSLAISDGKGTLMVEWWCQQRKITIMFYEDATEYTKFWGDWYDTEMETGILKSPDDFTDLWRWLAFREE